MARSVIERLLERLPAPGTMGHWLLNVNVPSRPLGSLVGLRTTRLGRRHPSAPVIRQLNPRGEPIYWIGAAGDAREAGEGTDFHATEQGFVSITPIHVDLTRYQALEQVAGWVADLAIGEAFRSGTGP